jgi:argininosuccinate lyase
MKLWQKESTSVSELVEQFTVGRDREFDLLLAPYDVEGSIAHVTMLGTVGLMTAEEVRIAVDALHAILDDIKQNRLRLKKALKMCIRRWNTC